MTLSDLTSDFLEYLELERKASFLTIRNYDHYLKGFVSWAGEIKPKEIDLELIDQYKRYLLRKPLAQVTQNYFLIAIRSFLRYLEKQNIKTLSSGKVELYEHDRAPVKVLDDSQLKVLLDAPDTAKKEGIRDKAILETILSTGYQVSELVSLNRGEINSIWLEKYLLIRKDDFKPLFIRFQGKVDLKNEGEAMRLTPRSIQRIVEKYVKKVALSVKATPHTLRYLHLTSSRTSPDL